MRGIPLLRRSLLAICSLLLIVAAAPASAQETTDVTNVEVVTAYTGVAVEPGDSVSLSFDVIGPVGDRVDLAVTDLPEGWDARIRGGGFVVDEILLHDGEHKNLKFEIDVPIDAIEGTYDATLTAKGSSGSTDRLDVRIRVSESVSGGVTLETEFPALRGPSDVQFSFTLQLANNTGEEGQFELGVDGPSGWQLNARPAGQSRASTVTVGPGESERITVEADPPDFTSAGVYPIEVTASGGGDVATADLAVEITGNFDITLITPDERLNLDVHAGSPEELPLVVINEGTATLRDVELSATPPRGWEVTFDPETIDAIEPNGSAEVTATVTASNDAITGDYRITLRARVPETSDQIELRATVETSAVWGLVGLGVIVIALAALGLVFRRFGRR